MDATTTDSASTPDLASATPTAVAGPCVLLTVEAAAARLSISRTRMYGLLKTGDVDSISIGRLRRIHTTEVDAYAARLTSTQPAA